MFRRPLGVVLAGGGAHGAWQAGCLTALTEAGIEFDRVLGVSVGSLSGVAYAIGELERAVNFWRDIDTLRVMRFEPRLSPFSLFSDVPIREALRYVGTEDEARARVRCEFTVVSLCRDDDRYHYARFTPNGAAGWDGPIADKLAASCAIPMVFPPVRVEVAGQLRTLVDGGARAREWVTWNSMAGCRDVIVLQMSRPEEIGGFHPIKRLRGDPLGHDLDQAVHGLLKLADAPRVFRYYPSARLGYSQFSFRGADCAPAVERGAADGRAFLSASERFLV